MCTRIVFEEQGSTREDPNSGGCSGQWQVSDCNSATATIPRRWNPIVWRTQADQSFQGALPTQFVLGAIPFGNVVIAPVASAIPTAQGVVDALKQTPAQVAILVPSVVAEIARVGNLLRL